MNGNSKSPRAIANALMSQLPTLSMEEQRVSLAIKDEVWSHDHWRNTSVLPLAGCGFYLPKLLG